MAVLSKHRENLRSVLAYSNATPLRGRWGAGYACSFCPHQCENPAALKTHTSAHSAISERYTVKHVRTHSVKLDVTSLTCKICNKNIKDLETLMRHLKIEHGKPMNFDINNHLIPFNFENKELRCVKCAKIFSNFKNMSEHMNDFHFRNYECDKCERGFVNKSTLVTHGTRHRIGEFSCSYCAKIFTTRIRRSEHERVFHVRNSKTRKCGYCNERFVEVGQKIQHEVTVHGVERPQFECNACCGSFVSQRTLNSHVRSVHLLHRPYGCTIDGCEKAFFMKTELNDHIISHGDAKPFRCTVCDKNYKSKKSLTAHKHTHDERREFQCKMCKKMFMFEDNLKLHLDKMHGIK